MTPEASGRHNEEMEGGERDEEKARGCRDEREREREVERERRSKEDDVAETAHRPTQSSLASQERIIDRVALSAGINVCGSSPGSNKGLSLLPCHLASSPPLPTQITFPDDQLHCGLSAPIATSAVLHHTKSLNTIASPQIFGAGASPE